MYGLLSKSCPTLMTPWTVACQTPLSIGFSRQEYWSGLPFPSPGDLPNLGIEPKSRALQADSLLTKLAGKPQCIYVIPNLPIHSTPHLPLCCLYVCSLRPCLCFCFTNRFICMRSFFFFMFYLLYFYFSVVQLVGLQNLSSLARD